MHAGEPLESKGMRGRSGSSRCRGDTLWKGSEPWSSHVTWVGLRGIGRGGGGVRRVGATELRWVEGVGIKRK